MRSPIPFLKSKDSWGEGWWLERWNLIPKYGPLISQFPYHHMSETCWSFPPILQPSILPPFYIALVLDSLKCHWHGQGGQVESNQAKIRCEIKKSNRKNVKPAAQKEQWRQKCSSENIREMVPAFKEYIHTVYWGILKYTWAQLRLKLGPLSYT